MTELQQAVRRWVKHYKSLRKAAKALEIDPAYLSRLGSGIQSNPSDDVLQKLGVKRIIVKMN